MSNPQDYANAVAVVSGVCGAWGLPTRCMISNYLPCQLGPRARSVHIDDPNGHSPDYREVNYAPEISAGRHAGGTLAWRNYLLENHRRRGPFYCVRRKAALPCGLTVEFAMVDLSRTNIRLTSMCREDYIGVGRRYTGLMVSPEEALVFRFPPTLDEMNLLCSRMTSLLDGHRVRPLPGRTWPVVNEYPPEPEGAPPVLRIPAGMGVPRSAYTLHEGDVVACDLEIVYGPSIVPRAGIQELELVEVLDDSSDDEMAAGG